VASKTDYMKSKNFIQVKALFTCCLFCCASVVTNADNAVAVDGTGGVDLVFLLRHS
jgi:hypothetical protein